MLSKALTSECFRKHTRGMERITAIEQALEIISRAKFATVRSAPAAWEFLYRVEKYLEREQKAAFAAYFGEAA